MPHAVGKILVRGVDACRQRQRLEEAEQRPQLVLDDQRMAIIAAGGEQHHRLAAQGSGIEQIEEVLEQAGVAALVGR